MKRFWSKVDRRGPDECWEWKASRNSTGYGKFYINSSHCSAHRSSWIINVGPIPDGMCVCHACDNPGCVNPAHLWLGTDADNIADRDAKGRQADRRGEKNGQAKLDEFSVRLIRRLYRRGLSHRLLGRVFGVCRRQIGRICAGQRWRHVSCE